MQFFGLPSNVFLVYEFLKSELNEDYFKFLKNKDLYETYKTKIQNSTVKKKKLTYRVFVNSIRFLEKLNFVKIVKFYEINNCKYTGLIPENYKYRFVGTPINITYNKVELIGEFPKKFKINLHFTGGDDIQLFTKNTPISFLAAYIDMNKNNITVEQPKKILIIK